MNHTKVEDYFRDIDTGRFPVRRGFHYSTVDLRLHLLFQELQSLSVDRQRYYSLFGLDIVDEHLSVWQALSKLKWAVVHENLITIEGDGAFYLPLIQNLLANDRLSVMRKNRVSVVGSSPRRATDQDGGTTQDSVSVMPTARAS